jgi:DUF4097 and DUF4098 domain-containing protein YvlB
MMWSWFMAVAQAGVAVDQACEEPSRIVTAELSCGSLQVVGGGRTTVRVTGSVDDARGLSVSSSGGRVRVALAPVAGWTGTHENCGQLVLEVPSSASVQIGTISAHAQVRQVQGSVSVETVSGHISVEAQSPEIAIETVSGNVSVTSNTQDLEVETVSGAVTVQGAGGDVELSSVSGDLSLKAGSELRRLEAGSVSGNIVVAGPLAHSASVEAQTHSGNVTLSLPANTSASVETCTFSGQVTNALGPTVGNGDAHVEASSFSGTVRILRLE